MRWKVGATYIDTENTPTVDTDYEDILIHQLDFVPKKEVGF